LPSLAKTLNAMFIAPVVPLVIIICLYSIPVVSLINQRVRSIKS